MKVYRSLWGAVLGTFLLAMAACGEDQQALAPVTDSAQEEASVARIAGEVFYRERIMLPPDSNVEVQLEDISRADALATVLESVSFKTEGGPPYAFVIEYDPASIDERMRYALRARITSPDGQLLFTNTEYIDPFADGPIRVMVQGVSRPEAPGEPEAAPGTVADSAAADGAPDDGAMVWILSTLGGEEAPPGAGGQPVDLHMNAADKSASGFSGCNRYTGGFSTGGRSTHGTPIKFGPMAGTMRACAEGGDLESAYLKMLGRVDAYRMKGGKLELLSGADVVATFRPR